MLDKTVITQNYILETSRKKARSYCAVKSGENKAGSGNLRRISAASWKRKCPFWYLVSIFSVRHNESFFLVTF